jgi:hypothetical protein
MILLDLMLLAGMPDWVPKLAFHRAGDSGVALRVQRLQPPLLHARDVDQGTACHGSPDGSNARRLQIALRFLAEFQVT